MQEVEIELDAPIGPIVEELLEVLWKHKLNNGQKLVVLGAVFGILVETAPQEFRQQAAEMVKKVIDTAAGAAEEIGLK